MATGKFSCDHWMWLSIGLATIAGFWLAYQKYRHFNGDTNDVAVFSYAFEQTMRGRFLPLYYTPGTLLGNHLNFIVLLWLPVYFFWQSYYSLFFFQTVMLTVSAWPLYLLARHVLRNERAALILGLVFLLYPTIASQHVNQLHDDQFALPFLMFALYFFVREDFKRFFIAMALACLAKETITITTAAFGVYALFLRRPWKWILTPMVFGVGYFVVAIQLLTTVLAGAGGVLYSGTKYLDAYGNTPDEVLKTFLTRPGFVLQTVFSEQKIAYLGKLLLPVLYALPFLSFAVLVSLPNFLLNLVGTNIAFIVIPWHYNIILGATLLAAAVFGIQTISARFAEYRERVATGIAIAMLVGSVVGLSFWYRGVDYRPQPHDAALRQAVTLVPQDASVLCPTPMLAHFSDRPKINTAYSIFVGSFKNPTALTEYDYVILDANWRAYEAIGQQPLDQVLQTTNLYQRVSGQQGVFVFKKRQRTG